MCRYLSIFQTPTALPQRYAISDNKTDGSLELCLDFRGNKFWSSFSLLFSLRFVILYSRFFLSRLETFQRFFLIFESNWTGFFFFVIVRCETSNWWIIMIMVTIIIRRRRCIRIAPNKFAKQKVAAREIVEAIPEDSPTFRRNPKLRNFARNIATFVN